MGRSIGWVISRKLWTMYINTLLKGHIENAERAGNRGKSGKWLQLIIFHCNLVELNAPRRIFSNGFSAVVV
jgi:hypothetical protein